MKFQIIYIFITLFLLVLVHAKDKESTEELTLTPGPIKGSYKENDLNESFDESSIEIRCKGSSCISYCERKGRHNIFERFSCKKNVLLKKGKVTINKAGTYILEGNLRGQLNIKASKDDLIHLVLRNATITSKFGPAIVSEKCNKVVITTIGENSISDSTNYPKDALSFEDEEKEEEEEVETENNQKESPNSCISINNKLTFNGRGILNVNGNFNGGITSKKSIKLVSGKINVISKGAGIKAKESLSIKEAEVNVDSGDSAITVSMDTDPEKGFVVIDGGKVIAKAGNDGIHAETHLTINGGYIDIIESEEGLEGQMIDITGGEIYVNSTDDGINASIIGNSGDKVPPMPAIIDENGNVVLLVGNNNNGPMPPPQGDKEDNEYETDLLDEDLEEATETAIEDAEPVVNSAAPPPSKDYTHDEQAYIKITGGKVHVKVEGNDVDGIDSNGSLYIGDDAEVYVDNVSGEIFGFIAALDANGSNIINFNSTVLVTATGKLPPFEEMPPLEVNITVEEVLGIYPDFTEDQVNQYIELVKEFFTNMPTDGDNFAPPVPTDEESSTCLQPYIRTGFTEIKEADTSIIVKDKDGKIIIDHKPRGEFKDILFTSQKINEGETYTLIAGDETITAVARVDEEE